MIPPTPRSTRTDTLVPYTTLFRSPETPALDGSLSASIVYFHVDDTEIDVDNVIKPILDALKTHIYADDRRIEQVTARRTKLVGLTVRNATRSEEHTSELQSLMRIPYAVFSLKKNKKNLL